MLAVIRSAALRGVDPLPICVEVDVTLGLPGFSLVGLPDSSVKEARERVFAAVKHLGFSIPSRRITINLAPADWKKEGSSLDLPLALGLLIASEQVRIPNIADWIIAGELSLDGSLRPIRGSLTLALHAKQTSARGLLIPCENAEEARLVHGVSILGAASLTQAIAALQAPEQFPHALAPPVPAVAPPYLGDFSDIRGQQLACRALEVAAAGGHHFVLMGSPGCGKTMMAKRMPSILPDMTQGEALETTQIYGCAGLLPKGMGLMKHRPFRQPHHTASAQALIGGGAKLRPGEVSLAHHGLLFLDEWPEFQRSAIESLRQPLEEGHVQISRVAQTVRFPSRFLLGAAMNPCPCGYLFDSIRACTCGEEDIARYRRRISGPMLDRMDLQIEVARVEIHHLRSETSEDNSATRRLRVQKARDRQSERLRGATGITCNALMRSEDLRVHAVLSPEAQRLLTRAMKTLGLSARAYDRVQRVARTLADLEDGGAIRPEHVAEAIAYRSLDRNDALYKADNSRAMTLSS